MSDKFKAIVIDNHNEKFTREIKEIDKSQLKDEMYWSKLTIQA